MADGAAGAGDPDRRIFMPLPDAAVDRVLLVHALEMSDDPERLLREVWRVLAPSGRLIAVIPNRRGVWTRTDSTPFGHGRPYSRAQITQLLRQTWFTPTAWGEALFMPPVGNGWFLRSAMAWERVGASLSLPFAGVHIVEATKQVYRALPAHRERTRLIPSLQPVLVPSSTTTRAIYPPSSRRTPGPVTTGAECLDKPIARVPRITAAHRNERIALIARGPGVRRDDASESVLTRSPD